MELWNWLNGRKTAIGLLLDAIAALAQQAPAIVEAFGGDSLAATQVVGRVVVIVGVLHKIVKGR